MLRANHLLVSACVLVALSFGVVACGDGEEGGNKAASGSKSLTIYSSLPLQGASRARARSIENGEKLALAEAGGKAGEFGISFKSLDDSTAEAGEWQPKQTAANARTAAQDKTTIAYIGDMDSGASAVSIPVLNEIGILQISPSNTAVGLTRSDGAEKGEPDKYYPAGNRNYGRVVPADHIQSAAQVSFQSDSGCSTTFILHGDEVYSRSLADQVESAAKGTDLEIVGNRSVDADADDYRSLASEVSDTGADCVFFSGYTQDNAAQLFKDLHALNPGAKLFGSDGVAESAFTQQLGSGVQRATYLTHPALDRKLLPRAGREFFKNYKARYGIDPDPYAIYGYEAMSVVLQAIRNAGNKGNDRQAVIDAFFQTRDRDSVLGKYSIDENGDTSLSSYGGYRVVDGKMVFDTQIKPKK
jgi:branched-chain amino acid transport system substrate-binding protein